MVPETSRDTPDVTGSKSDTQTYYVFGLRIQSNAPIPGFTLAPCPSPADVTISLGSFPEQVSRTVPPDREALYISPDCGTDGGPSSRVWTVRDGEFIRILYSDGTDCVVDRQGTRIWVWWPEPYAVADVVPYLQGQLLGLVQRLRGVTCLHASAILVGDFAIAVTGPRGSGKSSTAAAFHQLGFRVMADDVTPIFEENGIFMARPAHPRLWLNPDMVKTLYGSSEALPQFAPSWQKRYLDLNSVGPGLPAEAKPLVGVYVLSDRAKEPGRPAIAEAAPHDIMLQLLCNTYVNHLLDPEMRSREFTLLSRLQQKVPVLLAHPHEDVSKISLLCQTILEDVAKRSASV